MSSEASNPEHKKASSDLDYWSFVELATQQVSERMPIKDSTPSHLALSLNRASGIITSVTDSSVHRPLGLQWSSFQVLFVLWVVGEIDQAKLTTLTNSSKATVSNLTNKLLSQGFIERSSSPTDRRTFRVKLTSEGEKVLVQAYQEQNELLTQWSSVLDDEERETLIALLQKVMRRRDIFGN